MMKINMFKNVNLKGYTLIEGFPGVGLVGPMAISYIIDKLGMEYAGYMESDRFPPLISIHKNEPMPPIRVYCNPGAKLVTVFAEFAVPLEAIYELSNTMYDFVGANKISMIYSIGGIPMQQAGTKGAYVIASAPALVKTAQKAGLTPIGEGVATGVSALLLLKAVENNVPDINIMVPVVRTMISPAYAEVAIESLNRLMNLKIDITELDREAKDVEERLRDIIKKHSDTHESLKKSVEESGPSMYA